jgi:hypothetical protein
MSTNGIIARSTGEGTFAGRYHHWDSYPSGLGVALVELYRGHFKRNLDRMLQVLLDEHPAGWSTIVHKDFKLKPGYTNVAARPEGVSIEEFQKQPLNCRPQCYCHGARHEEGFLHDEKSECGASWAYVFETIPAHDDEPEQTILHVLFPEKNQSGEYPWKEAGRIDLDSEDKIDWVTIECGENFERCGHYAWYHQLAPRECNLSTRTFLGLAEFDFHDAVAFIVNGKRYKATGSGGNSDYFNRHGRAGKYFPRDTWVASVKAGNGRRLDVPVARIKNDKYVPLENVEWVYPATRTQPRETIVGVRG